MLTDANQNFRMLVVDDDSAMTRLIASSLNRKFSDVLEVSSTVEPAYVWGLAATGCVDLCVTDMNMPSINGFKLLKQLKELNPLTQVIFLTAHPTVEAARSAFAMGADDFLAKPVNLETLGETVQFMLNRLMRWQSELVQDNSVTAQR